MNKKEDLREVPLACRFARQVVSWREEKFEPRGMRAAVRNATTRWQASRF